MKSALTDRLQRIALIIGLIVTVGGALIGYMHQVFAAQTEVIMIKTKQNDMRDDITYIRNKVDQINDKLGK